MEIEKIYGDLPILETERLILRKVTLDDAEDIFSYGSNEEVSKYVTWNTHQTLSETKEFIGFVMNKYESSQVAPWGIEHKETGKFIGTIDFVWWQPNQKIAEIGYVISQDYWGNGLTTEVAKEVIRFGFEKMDLVRIQARCFVENIGSARVMEKTGMSFEGILRKGMFVKGKHRDLKMYSILEEEFYLSYLVD
ncbi:ribosomal-protein-alanine N-acetyltransferase [Bacillus sp. OV166]|uniref:GNAT family N-acetyltransferase n=1 Tax=Bacillus sp. OV166 TaxID=1882763 RepID=UPI000A2AA968|nr:GNAT family protein [Bacillus sp. OV166]SMQ80961.1 ribosomal-protein-alanine N-acetyltransferase [Bacillus sp. OV166]